MILAILLASSYIIKAGQADGCIPRSFGNDSIVCVCNATYCDSTPTVDSPEKGSFLWYRSNKLGDRMLFRKGKMKSSKDRGTTITLHHKTRYQKIIGFGGAFTDSAGINILNLSQASQDNLLQTYFGVNGSRYNFGRTPIGGCDFSTRLYTLNDVKGDVDMKYFSLTEEDLKYKIPFIKKAQELNPDLKLSAAAWTAPPWMKTRETFSGFGILEQKYFESYSHYLIKFLQEYDKHGIRFWSISTGNEPSNSVTGFANISTMGWIPKELGRWIAYNFGPSLKASGFNETLLLILDDQRYNLPWFVDKTFAVKESKKYVDGIATHFYYDYLSGSFVVDITHKKYPDKFILMTEACIGLDNKICLGCWERTETYILQMIENLEHWSVGWIDWNIALNKKGAPNVNKNYVEAAIIVNEETDEFFKLPQYYVIHHFSRFISSGSVRLKTTRKNVPLYDAIQAIAFETPQKETVVVLYNKNREGYKVVIEDDETNYINIEVSPFSLHTIIYQR